MKVALVCGDSPAGSCGVTDYTGLLDNSLRALGIASEVIRTRNWALHRAVQTYFDLRRLAADILHIQYPTWGFGSSLGPQVQALLRSSVVTIHELSHAHILRKFAMLPFSMRPKHIILPSRAEYQFALRWVPWISRRSSTVPIPSNIKAGNSEGRATNEIIYFGLIMPNKGLEQVIKLATLIECNRLPIKVRIIGTAPVPHHAYFDVLRRTSSKLAIIWDNGLNDQQVADRLAASSVAYLPYPDGISERRASWKAALVNGVAVITTPGQDTPPDLRSLVYLSDTPEKALCTARFLLDDPAERAQMAARAARCVERFSWETVAEMHLAIYNSILEPEQDSVPGFEAPERREIFSSKL